MGPETSISSTKGLQRNTPQTLEGFPSIFQPHPKEPEGFEKNISTPPGGPGKLHQAIEKTLKEAPPQKRPEGFLSIFEPQLVGPEHPSAPRKKPEETHP